MLGRWRVSALEEAHHFLKQLQAQAHAALGTSPGPLPPDVVNNVVERALLESLTSEDREDPEMRAHIGRLVALGAESIDDLFSEVLTDMQEDIEKTAAARIDGIDLGSRRPLVGYLPTGQLNAVSMRVPGHSDAYLVLFEDQMTSFTSMLSEAVAWAVPRGAAEEPGKSTFLFSGPDVTKRIESEPGVAERFADIVVTYAVGGSLAATPRRHRMPPGYFNLAAILSRSLQYFVLGHEYAHILLGHCDTAPLRKGVLPVTEAETLAYSWGQELLADWLGMILAINAGVEHDDRDIPYGFVGIGLFFDALAVMDRAVALLQTGDENACQLGSHPPSNLRKQRLREFLPELTAHDPNSERVQTALLLDELQGEIIELLWERTRPILLDLRRRGVPAARTWRTIGTETGDEPAPGPPIAPAPKQARRRRWGRSG